MSATMPVPEQDAAFERLLAYAATEMGRLHVPGVAIGVLHEGKAYTGGLGVTSVEHPLPVDAQTLFLVGSIGKTMTTLAVMRLVEQGQLDLETPIRAYLPDLRLQDAEVTAQVTLRHVFTHTGGWIGDFYQDMGMGDDALSRMVTNMADLTQVTPLGTRWSYNSAGFYLAGRILEMLTGQCYEEAMRALVFEPLGMQQTFFFAHEVMTYRFSVGHDVRDAQPVVVRPWTLPRSVNPAGGVSSTLNDLLRYARFHLGDGTTPDGKRWLSPESMRFMQSPQIVVNDTMDAVGLTWWLKTVAGVPTVGHDGIIQGQISRFLLAPERGFALILLTNAECGAELNDLLEQRAFQQYLGISQPKPARIILPQEQLASYVGQYALASTEIALSLVDGELVMRITEQDAPQSPAQVTRLAFLSEDRVIALDPPLRDVQGTFLRSPDGRIDWFRFFWRIYQRQAL